eukprot:TRINITY_DN2559_c0_g1_i2.p1 TRINITY_DN2559_c0_g1~~TRINITY_DN2559_c0_g1_i2.p1  ORF type:complete len:468 (+),score=64.19 TRINITY_DN2559_c0_g1_i2:96-1499(+)
MLSVPLTVYYYFAQWPPIVVLFGWIWLSRGKALRLELITDQQDERVDHLLEDKPLAEASQLALSSVILVMCSVIAVSEVLAWREEQHWDLGIEAAGHLLAASSWAAVTVYYVLLHKQHTLPSIGLGLFFAIDFLAVSAVGIPYTIDCFQGRYHEWWVVRYSASTILGLISLRYVLFILFLTVVIILLVVLVVPCHLLVILFRMCCFTRARTEEVCEETHNCRRDKTGLYDAPVSSCWCSHSPSEAPPEGQVHVHLVVYQLWTSWLPLYSMGLGAFHSALELGDLEWCFECPDGLVSRSCRVQPDYCLGNTNRIARIFLGTVEKDAVETMLENVRSKAQGDDYGIVTYNCHHVVSLMWSMLGGDPGDIPGWVVRLHKLVLFFFPRSRVRQIERALVEQELQQARRSDAIEDTPYRGLASYAANHPPRRQQQDNTRSRQTVFRDEVADAALLAECNDWTPIPVARGTPI